MITEDKNKWLDKLRNWVVALWLNNDFRDSYQPQCMNYLQNVSGNCHQYADTLKELFEFQTFN
jgi:hypothetical protein